MRYVKWIGVALLLFHCAATVIAATVTLAWDHSPDDSVVGYKIYHGVKSQAYTNFLSVTYTNEASVNNLVVGVTYYFAATAYTEEGLESDFSNEVVYTVPSDKPRPPPPPPGLWVAQ